LGLRLDSLGFDVVFAYLSTPLAIAIHRHVLLGETTRRYSLNPLGRPFLRFFCFAAMLSVIFNATEMSGDFLVNTWPSTLPPLVGQQLAGWLALPALFLFVGLAIVIGTLLLRSIILYPAIAVEAPGASVCNAMKDGRGYSLDILLIVLFIILPVGVVVLIAAVLSRMLPPVIAMCASVIIQAAYDVVTVCAFAAFASRLYQAIGESLGQPSSPLAADPPSA
jgi:hypothetical protein